MTKSEKNCTNYNIKLMSKHLLKVKFKILKSFQNILLQISIKFFGFFQIKNYQFLIFVFIK